MEERKNYNFSRQDILSKAYDNFLAEVYERAQPSLDIHEYIKKVKAGEINPKTENPPLYDRHYMQHNLIKYISDKYKEAYRIKSEWNSNCELLIKDVLEGGTVDKYIDEHTDEDGNYHPGHRGYDKRPPVKELLREELKKTILNVSDEILDSIIKVFEIRMNEVKDFYCHDMDERRWENTVWLNSLPTSKKETVIEFWKSQGKDIEIKDIPEDDFYFYDNGYSDEEIKEEKEFDNREKIEE